MAGRPSYPNMMMTLAARPVGKKVVMMQGGQALRPHRQGRRCGSRRVSQGSCPACFYISWSCEMILTFSRLEQGLPGLEWVHIMHPWHDACQP